MLQLIYSKPAGNKTKQVCFVLKAGCTRKTSAMLYRVFRPRVGGKKYNEKTRCQKQTQTVLYSPILVHLFPVSYYNAMVSRLHAMKSVLTNTTNLYKFILVRPSFMVSGSKIPTQAIIDLIHGFCKAISRLQSAAGVWRSVARRGAVRLYPLVTGFQPRQPLFKKTLGNLTCSVMLLR